MWVDRWMCLCLCVYMCICVFGLDLRCNHWWRTEVCYIALLKRGKGRVAEQDSHSLEVYEQIWGSCCLSIHQPELVWSSLIRKTCLFSETLISLITWVCEYVFECVCMCWCVSHCVNVRVVVCICTYTVYMCVCVSGCLYETCSVCVCVSGCESYMR